jgi:hypothetical protein
MSNLGIRVVMETLCRYVSAQTRARCLDFLSPDISRHFHWFVMSVSLLQDR